MARNNTTRVGRRRRVLNEEVLSARNANPVLSSKTDLEPGDTPRYGVGANIENHPQVTSLVPRRYRTLCLIALGGIVLGVTAELAAHFASLLSEFAQVISPEEITEVLSTRLVAWTSATLLLLVACYTRLIYSLRRHRVDDSRGHYRVWRIAGMATLLLSFNAIVGVHELVARYLGSVVDWQFLPASVGWWLVPAALLGGGLLIKISIDAAECRSALAFYGLAGACLIAAGMHSAGWAPVWADPWPGMLGRSLPLLGHTFLLIGSMLFARYVILDVQGLIKHTDIDKKNNKKIEQKIASATLYKPEEVPHETVATEVIEVPEVTEAEAASSNSAWVDGSVPEMDYGDSTRRLSKAERKRLRKQKHRRRAS